MNLNTCAAVRVKSYNESTDEFAVEFWETFGGAVPAQGTNVPGLLLAIVLREYGEPSEFVGNTYELKFGELNTKL